MPQRNGPRSSSGRSSIARRAIMGGASPTNGFMPHIKVMTSAGTLITTSYFGGNMKGGLAPNATAFNRASTHTMSSGAGRSNYLFNFKTHYGAKPFGPYLG